MVFFSLPDKLPTSIMNVHRILTFVLYFYICIFMGVIFIYIHIFLCRCLYLCTYTCMDTDMHTQPSRALSTYLHQSHTDPLLTCQRSPAHNAAVTHWSTTDSSLQRVSPAYTQTTQRHPPYYSLAHAPPSSQNTPECAPPPNFELLGHNSHT